MKSKWILVGLMALGFGSPAAFAVTDIQCTIYKVTADGKVETPPLHEKQSVVDNLDAKVPQWFEFKLPEATLSVACQSLDGYLNCTFVRNEEEAFAVSSALGNVRAQTQDFAVECGSKTLQSRFLDRARKTGDLNIKSCNRSETIQVDRDVFWGQDVVRHVPEGNCQFLGVLKEASILDCGRVAQQQGYGCFQVTQQEVKDPFWGDHQKDRACFGCL